MSEQLRTTDRPAQAIGTLADLIDEHPYTIREIAQVLRCSVSFVQKQVQAGHLKCLRFGDRLIRIRGRDVRAWVDAAEIARPSAPGAASPAEAVSPRPTKTATKSQLSEAGLRYRNNLQRQRAKSMQ